MREVITVATWNVLHRIHAENWGEDVPARWPDEQARVAAITARIAARPERVIALQEVSGDQLASLRAALPGRTVHALRYPRVPSPRRVPSTLRDPAEHLVLLLDGPGDEVAAESFADDPGKGVLAVRTAGALVVATHLSTDDRGGGQLKRLAELAAAGPAILLGDFNADRVAVGAGLGPGFTVAEQAPGSLPPRPRASGTKSTNIDHVIARAAAPSPVAVEDAGGLSDHNPVHAAVTL